MEDTFDIESIKVNNNKVILRKYTKKELKLIKEWLKKNKPVKCRTQYCDII